MADESAFAVHSVYPTESEPCSGTASSRTKEKANTCRYTEYGAKCKKCGRSFRVSEGGGLVFHLLHCDRCGKNREVEFSSLGELHLRYLKGLPGSYSVATSEFDLKVMKDYPGKPLSETEYHAEVEKTLRPCRCGGRFRFDAPPRCPKCRSSEFEHDQDEPLVHYDRMLDAYDDPWDDPGADGPVGSTPGRRFCKRGS